MKTFYSCFLSILLTLSICAQTKRPGNFHHQLAVEKNDTQRVVLLNQLIDQYTFSAPDSALHYAKICMELTKQARLPLCEASAMDWVGYFLLHFGKYPQALRMLLNAVAKAESVKPGQKELSQRDLNQLKFLGDMQAPEQFRSNVLANLHSDLGRLYKSMQQYNQAISHFSEAIKIADSYADNRLKYVALVNVGISYMQLNKLDTALMNVNEAYQLAMKDNRGSKGFLFVSLGLINFRLNNFARSEDSYKKALHFATEENNPEEFADAYNGLGNIKLLLKQKDSALVFAYKSLQNAQTVAEPNQIFNADTLLAAIYEAFGQNDSALHYEKAARRQREFFFNAQSSQQFEAILNEEAQRKADIAAAETAYKNKLQLYALIAGMVFLIVIALLLFKNNRVKHKANIVLERQKSEIESALSQLKSTQSQLIQKEKMASLGELTAGIAHEIQNPLNFVNNFSDVNTELLDELEEEAKKGNLDEVKLIAGDIRENEQKINHHGKRADAIVKGMLEHSRASTGQKEPTDINALADEYLRLSYHGLRAKDKDFNATIETSFDESIGKVEVVPQDIGRVLLNLYNNAFYAVSERCKVEGVGYKPAVWVTTKKEGDKIVIKVRDNGPGIPEKVVGKIFQPFFTTKPTGQGTGLGLSLSYDIIKAHGGELKVDTKEGEGAEFIIKIPSS